MLNRRTLLTTAGATVALASPLAGMAQGRKDAIVIGMALEPPGLDPTTGAAAAIAEVVQYNILETLTKINSDGARVQSFLKVTSWENLILKGEIWYNRPVAEDVSALLPM